MHSLFQSNQIKQVSCQISCLTFKLLSEDSQHLIHSVIYYRIKCPIIAFVSFSSSTPAVFGSQWCMREDMSEVPRLPDPNLVYPPTPRRRCQPERPKTLDFLVRPRPSPRIRSEVPPWGDSPGGGRCRGDSPSHTSSTETPPTVEFEDPVHRGVPPTPGSPWVNDSLLDQRDEGQCRDGTIPLCRPEKSLARDSPYRVRPGFWS